MKVRTHSITNADARQQSRVAIILMSVIPLLVTLLMMVLVHFPNTAFSIAGQVLLLISTVIIALSGHLIMRKYPDNIVKLREYISKVASGAFPDEVALLDVEGSDDIRFIEDGFNAILSEMQHQVHLVEEQLLVEQELRRTIEDQQKVLIQNEQHRAMIQTLGAACHHIGQPATILGLHLYLMKERAESDEARKEIDECMTDLELISDVLEKLKVINTYKTTSYLKHDDESTIIDIQ